MQKKTSQSKLKLLTRTLGGFMLGGGAIITYQIKCLKDHFSCLLSEEAIEHENKKASTYIEVPQMLSEIKVSGMISKVLSMEQLMETLFRGPKSLGHDTNPWHLLRILKSELHARDHAQALKTLATSHFNIGLSQQIAQACDFKIAVKLARSPGVNMNLFLQPPSYLVSSSEAVEDELLKILASNPLSDEHKCAEYFMNAADKLMKKEKHEEYFFGWDLDSARLTRPKNTAQIVELYLQALFQQSRSFDNSKIMVNSGVLPVLWRVAHQFPKEANIKSLCVRIVANISKFTPLHLYIFQSGWVGKLAEYMRSENLSLGLAAGKALANMDESLKKFGTYDEYVYLFNPLYYEDETKEQRPPRRNTNHDTSLWDMDVIFVHGLLGGVGWTWRQSEALGLGGNFSYCWPKDWLPQDVPNIRVLGIDYATSLSHWRSRCPDDVRRSSIASRADELLNSLKEAGVGRRPIVWVGHSMGGLLIKQLLVSASRSDDEAFKRIASNSKAVLMLSVPHDGSNVASLNSTVRFFLLPSVEVEELRKGSDILGNLNADFKELLKKHPIAIVSVVETKSTPVQPWGQFKFVEPSSIDLLSSDEVHFLPVDHFEICKPLNKKSFVYQRLVKLLWGVRGGSPPKDLVRPTGNRSSSEN